MTGFIRGLFGSKAKAEENDNAAEQTSSQALPPQKPGAFFLAPDEAMTFGDIEYMRSVKPVKKTFPKIKGLEQEGIQSQAASATGNGTSSSSANGTGNASQSVGSSPEVVSERRRADTSMDMFRNMARDIKKS